MNRRQRVRLFAIVSALATGLFLPQVTLAQGVSGNQLSSLGVPIISGVDFYGVLALLIDAALIIAGLVAFIYAFIGGYMYLTAGADDSKANKGRAMITNAIIGLVIISMSFVIISFIITELKGINNNNPAAGVPAPARTSGTTGGGASNAAPIGASTVAATPHQSDGAATTAPGNTVSPSNPFDIGNAGVTNGNL